MVKFNLVIHAITTSCAHSYHLKTHPTTSIRVRHHRVLCSRENNPSKMLETVTATGKWKKTPSAKMTTACRSLQRRGRQRRNGGCAVAGSNIWVVLAVVDASMDAAVAVAVAWVNLNRRRSIGLANPFSGRGEMGTANNRKQAIRGIMTRMRRNR